MTDIEIINRKIRALVRTVLSLPENSVRKANTSAPTGAKTEPFATVLITSITDASQDERRLIEIPNSTQLRVASVGQRIVSASIQFYRDGAYNNAIRLMSRLSLDSSVEKMQELGLGLIGYSPATNVTQLINTEWEEQARLVVDFNAIVLESELVDTYGTIEIQTQTDQSDGFIDSVSTINLDVQI